MFFEQVRCSLYQFTSNAVHVCSISPVKAVDADEYICCGTSTRGYKDGCLTFGQIEGNVSRLQFTYWFIICFSQSMAVSKMYAFLLNTISLSQFIIQYRPVASPSYSIVCCKLSDYCCELGLTKNCYEILSYKTCRDFSQTKITKYIYNTAAFPKLK